MSCGLPFQDIPFLRLSLQCKPRYRYLISNDRQHEQNIQALKCTLDESQKTLTPAKQEAESPAFLDIINSDDQRLRKCNFRRSPSSSLTTNKLRQCSIISIISIIMVLGRNGRAGMSCSCARCTCKVGPIPHSCVDIMSWTRPLIGSRVDMVFGRPSSRRFRVELK